MLCFVLMFFDIDIDVLLLKFMSSISARLAAETPTVLEYDHILVINLIK